jgi:cysteine desulfurase
VPKAAVYLDYNATAPVRPEVVAAMADAMAEPGNASSVHRFGRAARARIQAVRRRLAERLDVAPDRVIFTSGGTEANHLALLGFPGPRCVSVIEHPSVLEADPDAGHIPAGPSGTVDLERLAELLARERPGLVSVMLANNETGVMQPVRDAAALAQAQGALLHTDAVQAFDKIQFTLAELGADLVTVSAHKLGGPPGVGALVAREGLDPAPIQRGGGQELRRRAGTENLAGIVGFGTAIDIATDWQTVKAHRDRLEAGLRDLAPEAVIAGAEADRLPNTSCILLPGASAATQLMALDLEGVAVSSGSACSSGKVGSSHVLEAMGLPPGLAACAIRISLGWGTVAADIDRFLDAWSTMASRMGGRLSRRSPIGDRRLPSILHPGVSPDR